MKVLVLEGIANPNYGGAEKTMSKFCKYLNNNGFVLFIAANKVSGNYANFDNKVILCETIENSLRNYYAQLVNLFRLIKFIYKNKPDVLLTHTIHNFFLLRVIKIVFPKLKIVVYFKWRYNFSSLGKLAQWGINGNFSITAINKNIGEFWSNFLKNKNITYIPDGIEFDLSSEFLEWKKEDNFSILFIGRIIRGKGLHVLLDSFKSLPSNFELTILGDFNEAKYKEEIIHQCKQITNKISIVEKVDSPKDYYLKSHLVVVPSIIHDAQPLVILESINFSTPVIGTRKGGIPEMFNFDPFWLIDSQESALHDKIKNIYNNPEVVEKKLHDLQNHVVNNYSFEKSSMNLLQFIIRC